MRKPPRKRPHYYHHGDLREALIAAALAAVEQKGPDVLSMASLAKMLGVSQPAPYRHFPDRDALLAAVATRAFREFAAALVAAAEAGPNLTRLSRMGHAYIEFGTRRPGIYRLMFASPVLTNASAGDELQLAAQHSFELLVAEVGDTPPRDRQRRALQIWVALHGVVMLFNQNLLREGGPARIGLSELVDSILAPDGRS